MWPTEIKLHVRVMCRKFECREDIHYKTQTGNSCEKCNSKAFRLGIEPASSGLLDQLHVEMLLRNIGQTTTWAIDLNECEHFLKANWDRSDDRI